jgi:4-hydroxybenzoate polyprenyltransferase
MHVTFTPADAAALLALLASGGFVTYAAQYLKRATMADVTKFGIALGLSIVMGALGAYAAGRFAVEISAVEAIGIVFAAATGFYNGVFKRYGWDKSVFPDEDAPAE